MRSFRLLVGAVLFGAAVLFGMVARLGFLPDEQLACWSAGSGLLGILFVLKVITRNPSLLKVGARGCRRSSAMKTTFFGKVEEAERPVLTLSEVEALSSAAGRIARAYFAAGLPYYLATVNGRAVKIVPNPKGGAR